MAAPYLPDLYGEINNGAHRKAAERIGAPALIWHQALWTPVSDSQIQTGDQNEPEKSRADAVLDFIRRLHLDIGKLWGPVEPPYQDLDVGPLDRVRVITLRFLWHGLTTRIRFEVHTEYITITSIIDASVKRLAETDSAAPAEGLPSPSSDSGVFNSVKQDIEELQNCIAGSLEGANRKLKCIELHDRLYHAFWENTFDQQILDSSGILRTGRLGDRFADFRGIVTCENYYAGTIEDDSEKLLADVKAGMALCPPFSCESNDLRESWHRTHKLPPEWARLRLNGAWPFIEVSSEISGGRTEFTVSRLMRGRMMYASALGPQPKEGTSGNEQPVYFYLHSATQSNRQIGRVVDRLCQLGTLRLASIIALPYLKHMSPELRGIEKSINSARGLIHDLINSSNKKNYSSPSASEKRQKLEENIVKRFDSIHESMNRLTVGRENPFRIVDSESIYYRLSRSLYYREQFSSLVGSLRISRLEGYQPYDEFVQRRLESAFGFIDAVGRRLAAITAEWRALDQLYLAASVTILTGEEEVLQDRIEKLQTFGEGILLLWLAPYYVYNLFVADFLGCNMLSDCSYKRWGLLSEDQSLVVVIWLGFWTYYLIRNRKALARSIKVIASSARRTRLQFKIVPIAKAED